MRHFAYPVRLGRDGSLMTVAQDSEADVITATIGVLSYRKGFRLDRPGLGIDDPTFRQGGADLTAIRADLAEQEPRADLLISRNPPLLQTLVDIVTFTPRGLAGGGAAAPVSPPLLPPFVIGIDGGPPLAALLDDLDGGIPSSVYVGGVDGGTP
jgi:hypothetical protein